MPETNFGGGMKVEERMETRRWRRRGGGGGGGETGEECGEGM